MNIPQLLPWRQPGQCTLYRSSRLPNLRPLTGVSFAVVIPTCWVVHFIGCCTSRLLFLSICGHLIDSNLSTRFILSKYVLLETSFEMACNNMVFQGHPLRAQSSFNHSVRTGRVSSRRGPYEDHHDCNLPRTYIHKHLCRHEWLLRSQ